MERYRDWVALVGRILVVMIFLLSGFNKVMNPQGTMQYMTSMGMTVATTFFYLGAIALEIGGGLSLLLGYWTRVGAAALILFMIPTTLIFHTNFADQNQMIHFMKNIAMTGGLLYALAYGPGQLSLDARLSRARGAEVGAGGQPGEVDRRRTVA